MAYTLIPEGFTLKQVSKAEKDAVDEYFGRERRGDYLEELLGNPEFVKAIGAVVLIPTLITVLLAVLKGEGVAIPEETGLKLVQLSPAYWLFKVSEIGTSKGLEIGEDINKSFTDLFGGGKFGDLFKP